MEMCKFKLALLAFLIFPLSANASAPTRPYNYVAHTTIDPAQNNSNENGLYTYLQAGVDTYSSGSITNDAISISAAISYSKLNLIGSITNNDINASAAIAYSKLNLSNGILNADINSSAAIVDTKLAQITTASKVSGTAITGLASLPGGAGNIIPIANIPTINWNPNNIQIFTSTGTWTKPSTVSQVYVKVWGAGGGAWGVNGASTAGGGGGGYSEGVTAVTTNVTVTVGTGGVGGSSGTGQAAGGNSSFAGSTTLTANGGSAPVSASAGGAGGTASNGSVNITGTVGGSIAGTSSNSGYGGAAFSGCLTPAVGPTNQSGLTGLCYGSGGSGNTGTANQGGSGKDGLVIVYY